jgi:hypothetical protein
MVKNILKLKNRIILNPVILLIIGLFFFSCSDSKIPDEKIIAKVGDRIITVDEFISSYDFSVSILRRGKNSHRTYLNYMIKELLLANEGFEKGLNKNHYVTSRIKHRTDNDLLEGFYKKYVYSKVHIPEEKIQEAVKKSTIKFRLLIWPTPSIEKAAIAYDEASKTDLADYIEKQINKLEIKNLNKKNFETDWFDYLGVPPNILAEIQNLEIGKPSKPIPYEKGYAIFQIIDLKREPIKNDELKFGQRRKKIYGRLFNIKSDSIVHRLMDSILTPLNIRVKNKTVDLLVIPLLQWIKDGITDKGTIVANIKASSDTSKDYMIKLKQLLPEKLYTSKNKVYTVEDYFNYMNYHRKVINLSKDPIDLKNRLVTEIGRMIKNKEFIKIAKKEGYLDSAKIKSDLKIWEEKWTYDVYRDYVIKNIKVTDEEMKKFFKERWRELRIANVDTTRFYKYKNDVYNMILFEKHRILLEKEIAKLKKKYRIWINEELLNKLDSDNKKIKNDITLFTVKNFSGEPLIPTVDLKWLSY